MSYSRDRDSATRGVGAIASRDMAHPQATANRQRARAIQTARRDLIMRGATFGPQGGVTSLGAISTASRPGGPMGNQLVLKPGGYIDGGNPTRPGAGGRTPPQLPKPIPQGAGGKPGTKGPKSNALVNKATLFAKAINARPAPTRPGRPKPGTGRPMRPQPTPPPPGTPTPDPTSIDTSTPIKTTPSQGPINGGGGGGGGTVSGGGGSSSTPDYPPVDLLDPDDAPTTSSTPAESSGTKTLLIAGGIGLLAYLLLSDQDPD